MPNCHIRGIFRSRYRLRATAGRRLLPLLLLLFTTVAVTGDSSIELRQPLAVERADGSRVHFRVEVADDPASRRRGLMHRHHMPCDEGMLFDYRRTRMVQMWMKNTFIPLDMLFIDAGGRIVHIVEQTEPHSTAIIDSTRPVRAVLEVNAGVVSAQDIRRGDRVHHPIFTAGRR